MKLMNRRVAVVAAATQEGGSSPHAESTSKPARSPYVLLFLILLIGAAATWVIPPGTFDHVVRNGVKFVVPNSLHPVPRSGVGIDKVFTSIANGMVESAPIIFLILFTGGAVAVLERSGAINSALSGIGRKPGAADFPIIAGVSIVFSILGTTGVVTNSVVAFVPLGMLLARSMNLPTLFGVALVYLGTYAGFNAAMFSPMTTGLSQRMAELPLFSGTGLRVAIYVMFMIVTLGFFFAYARLCRRNNWINESPVDRNVVAEKATVRHWLILSCTTLALSVFIYGAIQRRWAEAEMTAMFIIVAVIGGLVGRQTPSSIANVFLDGCGKLVHGALIVGLARAISIVLDQGKILDPIVNFLSQLLAPLHPAMAAIGMFFSAALMHVAISSGAGESAALVPIFTPVGDAIHLTRQVTVEAILLGEGIINCFNPTSGVLMAVLATAGIAYGKWIRFVMPLIVAWTVVSIVALIVGVSINWGPF